MVGAGAHPAGVRGHVVDAVGDRLAEFLAGEVVHVHLLRLPGRLVFPPAVLEVPDVLFLLRIHRDHRLARGDEPGDLLAEVTELGVAVLMLAALGDLGVALQAEPQAGQHPGHRPVRDRMTGRRQRPGQVPGRLRRPHQRRHRVSAGLRVDQRLQLRRQVRVGAGQFPAPPAGRPDPGRRPGHAIRLADPRAMVSGCTPVAPATALIPPRPSSRASAPSSRRRCRSSRCGRSTAYFRAADSAASARASQPQTIGVAELKT